MISAEVNAGKADRRKRYKSSGRIARSLAVPASSVIVGKVLLCVFAPCAADEKASSFASSQGTDTGFVVANKMTNL